MMVTLSCTSKLNPAKKLSAMVTNAKHLPKSMKKKAMNVNKEVNLRQIAFLLTHHLVL